jgi:hypothetical protein
MPQIGVIYGTESKIVRRVVIPDSPGELPNHVGDGESLFRLELPDDPLVTTDADWISRQFYEEMGIAADKLPSARCALVDASDGIVTSVLMADPVIDKHDDGSLIQTDTASINDKHDGTEFLKRFAIASNDVVIGFIWDATLPKELLGMAASDNMSSIGDAISIDQPKNAPVQGVETL